MNSLRQLARHGALPSRAAPRVLPVQTSVSNRLWQRCFSATPAAATQAGLDPSKLEVTKTSTPKEITASENLIFGKTFTGKGSMRQWPQV